MRVDWKARGVRRGRRTTGGRRLWVPRDGGIPVARARRLCGLARSLREICAASVSHTVQGGCARAPGPLRLRPSPSAPSSPERHSQRPALRGADALPRATSLTLSQEPAAARTLPRESTTTTSGRMLSQESAAARTLTREPTPEVQPSERQQPPYAKRGANDATRSTRGPMARDAGGGAPGLARSRRHPQDHQEGVRRGPKQRCGEHVPRGRRRREGPTAVGPPVVR